MLYVASDMHHIFICIIHKMYNANKGCVMLEWVIEPLNGKKRSLDIFAQT